MVAGLPVLPLDPALVAQFLQAGDDGSDGKPGLLGKRFVAREGPFAGLAPDPDPTL